MPGIDYTHTYRNVIFPHLKVYVLDFFKFFLGTLLVTVDVLTFRGVPAALQVRGIRLILTKSTWLDYNFTNSTRLSKVDFD